MGRGLITVPAWTSRAKNLGHSSSKQKSSQPDFLCPGLAECRALGFGQLFVQPEVAALERLGSQGVVSPLQDLLK